jgi:membrane-bound lytic murein transglycosylase D
MTNVCILLLLALWGAGSACAADTPQGWGSGAGFSEGTRREHIQLASALSEAEPLRLAELAEGEVADPDDLAAADEFELKLPEEELPDSDIPLTFNSKVSYFIRYFQGGARDSFARWLSRSERYIPMMRQVLQKEGLPEDLVYLAMIESGFSPHAFSVASAVGPWQFMSATGKRYALRIDPWIDERRDPLKSSVAAALYLKELYALFNNDWYLAAAGYNAGENKILRAINMYNTRDFWELSKGEYLKRETKDYVPKLLAAAIIAKEPAKYGFADVAYLPPIEFDLVQIPSRTDLEVVAKACDVAPEVIRQLNPELRRSSTPPDYPGYELKIPKGKSQYFLTEYAKVPEGERYKERVRNAVYRAKRKDTLASVARKFHTTPETIAELNNLGKKPRSLRGKLLTVPVRIADRESGEAKAPRAAQAKAATKTETVNKYYTVQKGDTLHSLARRFNVTARLLSAWNNLKLRVALKPGKRIIVAKYQGRKDAPTKSEG